ncbi:divalent-cation tolerance protein CutA [Cyanobium sp. FGCU-6]|jgi:periplasmic divalent cation tolerance protein|nr:divalent-cation tolerance protein CutA [Cyanobium sp. FGCU6]
MGGSGTEQTLEIVLTTEVDEARAESLATALLERRLVACVALVPVRSLYRWQGRIERSEEVQLLLKTTPECLHALEAAMRELHSYEIPEWIHWRASAAGSYGQWCGDEVAVPSPDAVPSAPAGSSGDGDRAG